jgi:hypothetical protein
MAGGGGGVGALGGAAGAGSAPVVAAPCATSAACLATASRTAVRSCFNSPAFAAVKNWPPVSCATQLRPFTLCFALGSKPMTWICKPGAACFSDFAVAQTLALQLSSPSVMSTTSRPVACVCLAASTSAAAMGFVVFGLKPAPNKSLPGVFELSSPGFAKSSASVQVPPPR